MNILDCDCNYNINPHETEMNANYCSVCGIKGRSMSKKEINQKLRGVEKEHGQVSEVEWKLRMKKGYRNNQQSQHY